MTRTTDRTPTLALLATTALLLAACGQSGPLYLPGNPNRVEADPEEVETGTDEIVEDDEAEARE
jgi:predicted small lipoprotein YifL